VSDRTTRENERQEPVLDRLYVLPGGWMDMAEKWLVQGGGDKQISVPMPYFLIEGQGRRILVDVGCNPLVATDAAAVWGKGVAAAYQPRIGEEDQLRSRLGSLDLEPSDITDVLLTHMHMDHAGGLQLFPHAKIWVQRREHRWAMSPDGFARAGYIKDDIDRPELEYTLLDGDGEIYPGLYVVNTPGHTPGHQSVLLQLPESGWLCLVGDAVYTRKILTRRRMPGVVWGTEETIASASRLELLDRAFGVRLIFNHDAGEYEDLPKAPDCFA